MSLKKFGNVFLDPADIRMFYLYPELGSVEVCFKSREGTWRFCDETAADLVKHFGCVVREDVRTKFFNLVRIKKGAHEKET